MDYKKIVNAALHLYEVDSASVEFIRQRGHTVYKVTDNAGQAYCLRLHVSEDNPLGSVWSRQPVINSELVWIHAVAEETPLTVQTPYKNIYGGYVSEFGGICCSLVKWLEGEQKPFISDIGDAVGFIKLVGMLHNQASKWTAPPGFSRPHYDSNAIQRVITEIDRLKNGDHNYEKEDLRILKSAVEKACRVMDGIEKTNLTWGMIHGDLVPENLVFQNGAIGLIDFAGCGYGFYLYDICVAFSYVGPPARRFFLDEYAKHFPLPDNHVSVLEALNVASLAAALHFAPDVPKSDPGFVHALASREAYYYVNDESYLFDKPAFFEQ